MIGTEHGLLNVIIKINRGVILKDIGESFKEKREEIGITLEEVSKDLGIKEVLLENLEEGNAKVFKDILEIKDTIESYSKYLGLDTEKIMDEYNDYLFEKTSKISINDIKERLEKTNKEKVVKKIKSPYTKEMVDFNKKYNIILIIVVFIIILLFILFVLKKFIIG